MRAHPRPRPPVAAFVLAATCAVALGTAVPARSAAGPSAAFTITDPRITESSGLAAGHRHPGVYWTHNDSGGGPHVYAIDAATGRTVATLTLRGATARDCEAISIGPDGDIYLGDIGDNLGGTWPHVWIYRFPEPRVLRDRSVTVTRYTVRYADGPRDAEALMVDPVTGRVYIASKDPSGGGLYQGPAHLSPSGTNVFRRIADVSWVTDGAFSPDGGRLLLRGYFSATDYRWHDGRPTEIGPVDLPFQRQGESVTYTPDGRALMVGSEGADSQVWRVPLGGADLPAAATRPTASASPRDPSSAPHRVAGDGAADRLWSSGAYTVGAVVLALAIGVVGGLRRLLRRGR